MPRVCVCVMKLYFHLMVMQIVKESRMPALLLLFVLITIIQYRVIIVHPAQQEPDAMKTEIALQNTAIPKILTFARKVKSEKYL